MKKLMLFALLVWATTTFAQRTNSYINFTNNQIWYNPAATGHNNTLQANLLLRGQNISISESTFNSLVTVDAPFKKKPQHALGVSFEYFSGIDYKSIHTSLSYAYKINLPVGKLALGADVSYRRFLNRYPEYDISGTFVSINDRILNTIDASLGAYYYTKRGYVGVSLTELFNGNLYTSPEANLNFYNLTPRRLWLMGGYNFRVSDDVEVFPAFVAQWPYTKNDTSNTARMGWISCNVNTIIKNRVWIGVGYRQRNGMALNLSVGVRFSKYIKVGFSYEIISTKNFNSVDFANGYEGMVNYRAVPND